MRCVGGGGQMDEGQGRQKYACGRTQIPVNEAHTSGMEVRVVVEVRDQPPALNVTTDG